MPQNLEAIIRSTIRATGPLPIAQYMHLCNSHPEFGYYATGHPVGKGGDFITAPEISQIFGELICVWTHETWQALDCPDQIQIVELGPGRGTMMKDIIRTTGSLNNFQDAVAFFMIETSSSLIEEQKRTLSQLDKKIAWINSIDQLPALPTIFLANEFLDAIPFRQFIKNGDQWHEMAIGLDEDEQLTFVSTASSIDQSILPVEHKRQPEGAIFEYAPAREAICEQIGLHIKSHNGAALFIDYGHVSSGFGDTFQAIRSHQMISPLEAPGQCDLTSHVDFGAIRAVLEQSGLAAYNILEQGNFLLNLGILERAGQLGHGKPASQQDQIRTDVERLAADDQMGSLFKVMCIRQPDVPVPLFS